jgi:hypothetical protein
MEELDRAISDCQIPSADETLKIGTGDDGVRSCHNRLQENKLASGRNNALPQA